MIMKMETASRNRLSENGYLWQVIVFCFMLAAITGALYRFGLTGWSTLELELENIRHAHSHLMFFGWAVPFPLMVLLQWLNGQVRTHNNILWYMRGSVWAGLFFGLLSYPFFLIHGYHPVEIGMTSLPLSVIFSGLVMISWYVYMSGYIRVRRCLKQEFSIPWFEVSLVMLFVSSLGAWGVAVLQAVNPQNQLLSRAMTHFFLSTFTEGWVVLVVIAVLFHQLKIMQEDFRWTYNLPLAMIAIGAPLTFPYGISESLLSPVLFLTARLGGLLASVGLMMILYVILKVKRNYDSLWNWVLVLLALKALMQLVSSVIPTDFWLSDHSLRIFYLHVLLLGVLTLTGFGWLHTQSGMDTRQFKPVATSIALVLVTLAMLSRFWPARLSGSWIYFTAAFVSLLPIVAVSREWIMLRTINTYKNYERYQERQRHRDVGTHIL